jgi:hypothetical protein
MEITAQLWSLLTVGIARRPWRLVAGVVTAAYFLGFVVLPARASSETSGIEPLSQLSLSIQAAGLPLVGPSEPPTPREILLDVCRERGYGEDCAKILYGMVWKESRFESRAVGDRGLAQGYFQIHYRLHGITLTCAQDLRCSAAWSLGYMERNGYPKYATRAVQCHNGCGVRNGYASSVKAIGARKWNEAKLAEAEVAKAKLASAIRETAAEPACNEGGEAPVQSQEKPVYVAVLSSRELLPRATVGN